MGQDSESSVGLPRLPQCHLSCVTSHLTALALSNTYLCPPNYIYTYRRSFHLLLGAHTDFLFLGGQMYLSAIMYFFFTPSAPSTSKVHFSNPKNPIGFCLENACKPRKYAILVPPDMKREPLLHDSPKNTMLFFLNIGCQNSVYIVVTPCIHHFSLSDHSFFYISTFFQHPA